MAEGGGFGHNESGRFEVIPAIENLGPACSRSDLFGWVRSEWDCKRVLVATKGAEIKK